MELENTNQPKIGIITYDHNHLKSEQVIVPLYNKGFDIVIYALPFVQRPTREVLFSHRPNQQNAQHPNDIANRLVIDYIRCSSDAQSLTLHYSNYACQPICVAPPYVAFVSYSNSRLLPFEYFPSHHRCQQVNLCF